MDTWSTSSKPARLTDPDACISVYLGLQQHLVNDACQADETNDHDRLGRLLGIPECCRRAYIDGIKREGHLRDPLFWLTWPEQGRPVLRFCPNPLSRYFSAGLISHYPCSLSCKASKALALENYHYLNYHFPHIAYALNRFEGCGGIYVEGLGVALFPSSQWFSESFSFEKDHVRVQGQGLKSLLDECDGARLVGTSRIILTKGGGTLFEISGKEIRAGTFNSQRQDPLKSY